MSAENKMPTPAAALEQLERLREGYLRQLPERYAELEHLASALVSGASDVEQVRALHHLAHKLAGGAGSFGLSAVSVAARGLEQAVSPYLGAAQADESLGAVVRSGIGTVREAVQGAAHGMEARRLVLPGRAANAPRRIFVVEDDDELRNLISARLGHAGYEVTSFAAVEEFRAVCCSTGQPDAIVMDIAFPDDKEAGIRAVAEMKACASAPLPVVFISVHTDIETRLKALRLGASRYLPKPLDLDDLLRVLDDITYRMPANPYRVLLVDDEPGVLAHHETILRLAGMETHAESDPLRALEVVASFVPDVIVLDLYMARCSGLELAALLREDRQFTQVPIIFLSSEQSVDRHLSALSLGADSFLTKPIEPVHLMSAVVARARRARQMNHIVSELRWAVREREIRQQALDAHAIVSIADAAGDIVYANRKFCEISGYSPAELIGRNHRLLKSGVHPASYYEEMWTTLARGDIWQGEICNRKKDGRLYWVESTIVPFLDDNGVPQQYVSVRTDITALKENVDRLRTSQMYANIGTWDWNIQSGELFWSERIAPLFGYHDGAVDTTYENFLTAVHPEDRDKVAHAVDACVEQGERYEVEHRVVWPDGTVRWLLERGDVVRDVAGKPLHLLGVVQDITERIEAENDLLRQHRLLAAISGAQGRFIGAADHGEVFEGLLADLLQLTESAYGFIGEVLFDDTGAPYLKTRAITNIAWDETTRRLYNETAAGGMEFRNLKTLFGAALASGQVVIANEPQQDARAGGLPAGHPPLNAFLGVPFFLGGKLVGMVGVANRPGGYDEAMLRFLEPLFSTVAHLIGAIRTEDQRHLAEEDLVAAKNDAERANRAKSEFLSSMSHELRTPMNAILGFSQILEADASLSDDQRESVGEILRAGEHLLELINEVLDLARIEAGRIKLSLESIRPHEALAEAVALIAPLADKRSITVQVENHLEDATAHADYTRLKQVLLNLLSNAVKYNRNGGSVRVVVEGAGAQRLRIAVHDTGVGIRAENLARLFQPFTRIETEGAATEGTGIGLVISKRLIELMGGNVGVESAIGRGSTFWIELVAAAPLATLTAKRNGWAGATAPPSDGGGKTVLYIEDNPANLKLVTQLLARRKNIRVQTAHTPSLGMELALADAPDVILLDINMPGMNGYEVLARLQTEPATRKVPVVAITANAMPRDLERGMAAGFVAYLTKPLNVAEFNKVVDRLLAGGAAARKG